jgi:DNA (cytosine-5)-methyltransferase 1
MKFGSVCSGIEAASTAWLPLGWSCEFMSEIADFPRAVLKHHYADAPLHGDFTTIQEGDYGSIDVLVGGTPCQSFSVAGLREGMADERGNLALEYLRLAKRLRPRWLLWENVPGCLSSNGGRDFGAMVGGMVRLGYGIAYRVLDAQHFGLAQRRRRVFLIGYLGNWKRAAAVLFEPASLRGHPAPRRESRKGVAPTIAARTRGGGGLGTDFDLDGGLIAPTLTATYGEQTGQDQDRGALVMEAWGGSDTRGARTVSTALRSSPSPSGRMDFDSETFITTHALTGTGFDASEDGTGRGTPIVPTRAYRTSPDDGAWDTGDIVAPLMTGTDATSHLLLPPAQAFVQNQRDEVRTMDVAGALGGQGFKQRSHLFEASTVRRLTPLECERLMGFPDGYTLIPWKKGMAPDGPRYMALGNSMAVPVISWIGKRIAYVDAN